jgi:hypothetical protein
MGGAWPKISMPITAEEIRVLSSTKRFGWACWKALSYAAAGERSRVRPDIVLESKVAVLALD